MRADKVLSAMLKREGVRASDVARQLGKNPKYLNGVIVRHSIPKADTFAAISDVLGYDLIARNRDDGFEFSIDPPA